MKHRFEGMLLASDFDGTLLDSDSAVSRENREALDYFTANGGYFTPATGRIPSVALPYCMELPVNTPCIFMNGAILYDVIADKVIERSSLPRDALRLVKTVMEEFPSLGVEIFTTDGAYVAQLSEVTKWHFGGLHLPINRVNARELLPLESWCKLNLTGDTALLSQVKTFLRPWQADFEMSSSYPLFWEITGRGIDKGAAVLRVAEQMGVSRDRIFTIGDSYNDTSMLRIAAHAFAPANAERELLEIAHTVVSHHDKHALCDVVAALEKL